MTSNYDPSSAFANAVQRARQIAAKIHGSGGDETPTTEGTKRPLEESISDSTPETKKLATSEDSPGSLSISSMNSRPTAIIVEEWKVPDKMVGLIIGRGGEQITRLQAESRCKVQMAADSGGLPERTCKLTGTRQAIEKAKELMTQIINRGGPPLPVIDTNHVPDGHTIVEMMIPGQKVGLVIGKGGETIRNLQERAGVKMLLIQDGPQQTTQEKPLRITGEPDKCDFAKQIIMDLITDKELESLQRGGFDGTNDYGSSSSGQPQNTHEIMVPRQAVGVVIGKGGDTIKRIQQDSGAKVQFLNVKDEGPEDKVCVVSGSLEQIQAASTFINDLIQSVLLKQTYPSALKLKVRDQQNVGRGRGRGRGFENSGQNFGSRSDMPEVHYAVPANKCGLVIGKGGETVKNINQQSGAYVTISALPPPNAQEKVFVIRGNPQQIDRAKELVNERIGEVGTVIQTTQAPSNPQTFAPQFPQQFQQAPAAPQPYTPQGWANAYQPWQGQAAAQAADPNNAAAWAAYYSQFYQQQPGQQLQPPQPQAAMQQAVAPQPGIPPQPDQSAQMQTQQPTPAGAPSATTAVSAAPGATGQPDYSAAWAEYYRSLGMFREVELIEQQARATQAQVATTFVVPQPGQPFPQPQPVTTAATPMAGAPSAAPQPAPNPVPTGVPAPGQAQPFPTAAAAAPPQGQWAPGPYPQQYGQQPNAYFGYNYPAYGQQQFAPQ